MTRGSLPASRGRGPRRAHERRLVPAPQRELPATLLAQGALVRGPEQHRLLPGRRHGALGVHDLALGPANHEIVADAADRLVEYEALVDPLLRDQERLLRSVVAGRDLL